FINSEKLSMGNLDYILDPGDMIDEANYTKMDMTLTNPEEGETINVRFEASLNTKDNTTYQKIDLEAGGEVSTGGVYFDKDKMLIQRADVDSPMVLHTLDKDEVESFKTLPAADRVSRLLSPQDHLPLDLALWQDEVKTYLSHFDALNEEDFIKEDESDVLHLNLEGEYAKEILKAYLELMEKDVNIYSFFNTSDDVSSLDLLDDLNPNTLELILDYTEDKTNFKMISTFDEGDVTFELEKVLSDKEAKIAYTYQDFDGTHFMISDQTLYESETEYDRLINYEAQTDDDEEKFTITTHNTINKDKHEADVEIIIYEDGREEAVGKFELVKEKNNKTTTIDMHGYIDESSFNFDIETTIVQSDKAQNTDTPNFIAGSGIETNSLDALYEVFEIEPSDLSITNKFMQIFSLVFF
ncbi:MAG TPA: hypothetical protein VFC75_00735, partial [Erysipelothrix sp.]|nr:hypothetical protein [Erysipelothrix sp.]